MPAKKGDFGELEALTDGEKLLVDRRRRDENQREAATRLGTTIFVYGKWELDKQPAPKKVIPKIKGLEVHEICALYRRRCGKSRTQVAGEVGVCVWWLTQMERGRVACDRLVDYWEN